MEMTKTSFDKVIALNIDVDDWENVLGIQFNDFRDWWIDRSDLMANDSLYTFLENNSEYKQAKQSLIDFEIDYIIFRADIN